jgi:hypothetical protein
MHAPGGQNVSHLGPYFLELKKRGNASLRVGFARCLSSLPHFP